MKKKDFAVMKAPLKQHSKNKFNNQRNQHNKKQNELK